MDKLKSVIGLAPSEMPLEALIQKLAAERARISQELTLVSAKKKAKAAKAPKEASTRSKQPRGKRTLSAADLDRLSQLAGIDLKTGKKLTP